MPKYAFFKGEFVPIEEAKVSIMTHAFNYGTGCFEGIRAYWNAEQEQLFVFKLREHYERLLRSCRILLISLPYSVDDLCQITVELLRREGYQEDTYIRPLAYKASEGIGVRLHDLEDDFALFALPFGKYIEKEEGARAHVSSWRRIEDNAIPARAKITGAYINSALSKSEAMLNGFDEAIVLCQDGHVSEGSAENLFIVRDGLLITPPVTANILEGITRRVIMEIAREELGIETVERPIDRSELYVAEEAFFCGTGVQVVAIIEIDRRPVGDGKIGPIVSQLRQLYFDIVRSKVEKYRAWCTPVYPQ
ncbi:MAG TPA: branched-chain amino acid transaminase [Anaerolineae bacterium]|nr:branched-chain amino acid transaminase [Anaerolineae bacterium]